VAVVKPLRRRTLRRPRAPPLLPVPRLRPPGKHLSARFNSAPRHRSAKNAPPRPSGKSGNRHASPIGRRARLIGPPLGQRHDLTKERRNGPQQGLRQGPAQNLAKPQRHPRLRVKSNLKPNLQHQPRLRPARKSGANNAHFAPFRRRSVRSGVKNYVRNARAPKDSPMPALTRPFRPARKRAPLHKVRAAMATRA
jgi:hypothetical protein